jgi:glycosyltransferase involved in cell wall biosynthesis
MTVVVMLLDNHHGPDRRVDMEVEMLNAAGARVRVVAWDRRDDERRAAADGEPWAGAPVELVRVREPAPPVGGLASIGRTLRFSARVFRSRRRLLEGAGVIVAHDLYLLPLGRALSAAGCLPLVYDAHEEFAAMEAGRYPGWLLRLVTRVETRLARRAALVVVPGETRAPRWQAAGIEPLVLPNMGRRVERLRPSGHDWDLAYVGGLSEKRRLDVLVELARQRPDLRVAVAGEGRSETWLAQASAALPNLEFHGETSVPDEVLSRARAIYYGLDSTHPYTAKSCPNTVYQAVRVGRPLLYFGGGEIERFLRRFRVGMRVEADPGAVAEALDSIRGGLDGWEFDEAWDDLERQRSAGAFAARVLASARAATR